MSDIPGPVPSTVGDIPETVREEMRRIACEEVARALRMQARDLEAVGAPSRGRRLPAFLRRLANRF